jgi:predicted MFS family arabinose efflux permease
MTAYHKKLFAACILGGGIFCPLIVVPLLGGFSYFDFLRLLLQSRENLSLDTLLPTDEPKQFIFNLAAIGFAPFLGLFLLSALCNLRWIPQVLAAAMLACVGVCFVLLLSDMNQPVDAENPTASILGFVVKQSWGWAILAIGCLLPMLPIERKQSNTSTTRSFPSNEQAADARNSLDTR